MWIAGLILLLLVLGSRAAEWWVQARCEELGHGPWVEVYGGRACSICGTIEFQD